MLILNIESLDTFFLNLLKIHSFPYQKSNDSHHFIKKVNNTDFGKIYLNFYNFKLYINIVLKKYDENKIRYKLWKQGWDRKRIRDYLKSLRDQSK